MKAIIEQAKLQDRHKPAESHRKRGMDYDYTNNPGSTSSRRPNLSGAATSASPATSRLHAQPGTDLSQSSKILTNVTDLSFIETGHDLVGSNERSSISSSSISSKGEEEKHEKYSDEIATLVDESSGSRSSERVTQRPTPVDIAVAFAGDPSTEPSHINSENVILEMGKNRDKILEAVDVPKNDPVKSKLKVS